MNDPPSRLAAFLAELRQRRVFRVAAVYAGMAFVLGEVANNFFPALNIPDWTISFVVVLLVIGFPIAVGMAWAFDLTAEGLVRAKVKREPTAVKAPHYPLVGNKTLAVIAAVAVAVAVWSYLSKGEGPGPITSIAVLPLDNLGGDPENIYFVEGMHEALISELSKIGAVTVISRRSTLQYKDSEKTMPTIASELGVDALVEGSALLLGERVRITTQLVDSQDRHLWSNTYERKLEDVFALYNDVTLAIAQEIQAKLTPEEETRLASAPQLNPEAYKLYLKGWHFRTLESAESIPKAVEYLEQAVALDSTFAQAWAALGHSYLLMDRVSLWKRDYAYNRMKQALDKALELDPNHAQAHACLGIYQWDYLNDLAAAEASYRRALELDPDNTYALYEYGLDLIWWGRPDEAMVRLRRGHELNPLSPQPLLGISWVYLFTRQYDKGLEYSQAVLELAPDNIFALGNIPWAKFAILMQQGRYAEAAAGAGKAGDLFRQLRAEWALGDKEKVYAVRDSLSTIGWEQKYPSGLARLYAIMGERDKALDLLEKAYEDTALRLARVYDPEFDFLRAEPRFQDLLQKMGLMEVFDQYGRRIR